MQDSAKKKQKPIQEKKIGIFECRLHLNGHEGYRIF